MHFFFFSTRNPGFLHFKIQERVSGILLKFCIAHRDHKYFYFHNFLRKQKCLFLFSVFTNKVYLEDLNGAINAIILHWAIIS